MNGSLFAPLVQFAPIVSQLNHLRWLVWSFGSSQSFTSLVRLRSMYVHTPFPFTNSGDPQMSAEKHLIPSVNIKSKERQLCIKYHNILWGSCLYFQSYLLLYYPYNTSQRTSPHSIDMTKPFHNFLPSHYFSLRILLLSWIPGSPCEVWALCPLSILLCPLLQKQFPFPTSLLQPYRATILSFL